MLTTPWQKPIGVLLTAGLMAAPVFTDWPTTIWVIRCSRDNGAGSIAALCDPENPASAVVYHERELKIASEWLEGLGFSESVIWRLQLKEGVPYAAIIDDQVLGPDVGGLYKPGDDDTGPGYLILSSAVRSGAALGAEAVHELFHGVQRSYHGLLGLRNLSRQQAPWQQPPGFTSFRDHPRDLLSNLPQHDWIMEGTAEAIRVAVARRQGIPYVIRKKTARRYYDRALHQSCSACDEKDFQIQVYNTVHFWLVLGKMLNSRDNVAFLHDIWA